MTALDRFERFRADEEYGRLLRSYTGPILSTTVEVGARTDQPDWNSVEHATDTLFRAVTLANREGLAGKRISRFSSSGCTQYGNLVIGWDYAEEPTEEGSNG